ncbi:MAG: hypothetical protein IPK92_14725 [Nitrospira sp.]|nr:hypothetical protein [Nitrospira sp.]
MDIKAEGTSGKIGITLADLLSVPSLALHCAPTTPAWEKLLAPTDGFLNGVVMVEDNGPRGILRLYSFNEIQPNNVDPNLYLPMAAVAVHKYSQSDRWISHASGMVPAGKGSTVWGELKATAGMPPAEIY